MDGSRLPMIFICNVIIQFITTFIQSAINLPKAKTSFWEALTLFLIVSKLNSPEKYASWTWICILFLVIAYFMLVIACFLALAVICVPFMNNMTAS